MAARKSKANKPAGRKVRSLRHWKQQYDENAAFIWRKRTTWGNKTFEPGDKVPAKVIEEMGRNKLRRFWEAAHIELAEFDESQKIGSASPKPDAAFLLGESNVMNQAQRDADEAKAVAKAEKNAQLKAARKAAADKKAAEAISQVESVEDGE